MTKTLTRGHARAVSSVLAVTFLLLISIGRGAQPQAVPGADQSAEPYQISVNIGLVVLNPVVRDRNGRFVPDLRMPDFEVYEDGVRQSIQLFRRDDLPVTVGLVVDHSASMRRKLADVIEAARTFVRSSNPADEMFVVNFNENVTLGLPGSVRFSNRPDELERAILKTPVTGQTALYDAVIEARERLRGGNLDKKVLVVISDGGDNKSSHSLTEALKIAEESGALVYTIGIFDADDADQNPGVLRRLARATGGEAFFPGLPVEVTAICERIARDIRNQYTIGYVSSNAAKSTSYRSIRVTASAAGRGKLAVRTRAGYTVGEPQPDKNGGVK